MVIMHLPAATAVDSHLRCDYLSNGLKVVVREIHTVPLVSVWCWYRVGSADEVPGRTGVSHWVEHMQGAARVAVQVLFVFLNDNAEPGEVEVSVERL